MMEDTTLGNTLLGARGRRHASEAEKNEKMKEILRWRIAKLKFSSYNNHKSLHKIGDEDERDEGRGKESKEA